MEENNIKKNTKNDDKENYITAIDYLIKQEELEQEAKEVLSKKFDKCTYDLGYIKQQVYVCLTCTNGNAGFCYSCSIAVSFSFFVIHFVYWLLIKKYKI